MWIDDLFFALPSSQIRVHHVALNGTRAYDRHFDHQVVERARAKSRQHSHLRAALDLKHADRVASRHHVVRSFVFRGNGCNFERLPLVLAQQIKRMVNAGECAEAQEVDLEQREVVDVVLVPLDDGARLHGGWLDGNDLVYRTMAEQQKPPG